MSPALLICAEDLSIVFAPAASSQDAQSAADPGMTSDQRSAYGQWPPELRTAYDRCHPDIRIYYWTLNLDQQQGWWALNDERRARVHAMTPSERAEVWRSIDAQLSRASAPVSRERASASAGAGTNNAYVSTPVVQGNLTQAARQGSEYPVCKTDQDDSCVNPYAAGLRGPSVERPLEHWPGRPASQIN